MKAPLIIAHRGASGHLPEHTLESYELAIDMGADFIEPDLVATKDGVLVARHENEISSTTNVAEQFPKRKTSKSVDGREVSGWFTEDFTLAELKTLRARERLSTRSQKNNDRFLIPTFEEIVLLAKRKGEERGQPAGLYPETKHPTYFRNLGLAIEPRLIALLEKYGLNRTDAPVFIQSFETQNLKELRKVTTVPLVQLIGGRNERPFDFTVQGDSRTYADLVSSQGLKDIATYANGIGIAKELLLQDTSLVQRAHGYSLVVHPYTFRSDKGYIEFFQMGVDGVFTDFSDHAFAARQFWQKSK